MAKFKVIVEQEVTVELDETKFDEDFMQEFREGFYSFDSLDEHAEHIAQLVARGLVELGGEPLPWTPYRCPESKHRRAA